MSPMELQEVSPDQADANKFDKKRLHPAGLTSVAHALAPLMDPKDSAPTLLDEDEDVAPLEPAVAVEVVDVAAEEEKAEAAEHRKRSRAAKKAAETRKKNAK